MTVAELREFQEAEGALSVRLERYAGKWVAVRDHEVIAAADSPSELIEQLRGQEYEAMFGFPEHGGGGCFF